MSQPDLATEHAGAPLPEPVQLVQTSAEAAQAPAGLVNQARPGTVEFVGPIYGESAVAAVNAAMSKRDSDWSDLMGGRAE